MSQSTDVPELASGETVLSVKSYRAIIRTRVQSQNPSFKKKKMVMMVHTCHPSTGEGERGGSLELNGQPASLIGKLQAIEKPFLKSKMGSS